MAWRPLALNQLHQIHGGAGPILEDQGGWEGEEEAQQTTAWRRKPTSGRLRRWKSRRPSKCPSRPSSMPGCPGSSASWICAVREKSSTTRPTARRRAESGARHGVQTSIYSLLYRANTGRNEKGIELHHLVKLKQPKVVITSLPPMSVSPAIRLFQSDGVVPGRSGAAGFVPRRQGFSVPCRFFNECRAWH